MPIIPTDISTQTNSRQIRTTLVTAYNVHWLSRSGRLVRDMYQYLFRISLIRPRLVFLICGGNDLGRGDSTPYSVYLELMALGFRLVRDYGVEFVFVSTVTERVEPRHEDFTVDSDCI